MRAPIVKKGLALRHMTLLLSIYSSKPTLFPSFTCGSVLLRYPAVNETRPYVCSCRTSGARGCVTGGPFVWRGSCSIRCSACIGYHDKRVVQLGWIRGQQRDIYRRLSELGCAHSLADERAYGRRRDVGW